MEYSTHNNEERYTHISIKMVHCYIIFRGVPKMAEIGYCPIFVAENGNSSAHFSGFGHKNCKPNGNIRFRGSENGNCQYDCHGYREL